MIHSLDFVTIYLTTVLFCITLVGMMALKMGNDLGGSLEIRFFRTMSAASVLEMLTQCLYAVNDLPEFSFPIWFQYAYNLADLLFTGAIVYYWYRFIDIQFYSRSELMNRTWRRELLPALPLAVIVAVDILSLFNHLVFYITPDGIYRHGRLYALHAACCFLYYILVLLLLIRSKQQHRISRSSYSIFLLFTACPTIGGIFQVAFGDAPITVIFFTLGMFLMFSDLQSRQINTDALTKLTNRAGCNVVLDGKLAQADKEPFDLYMADINHFKEINDRYGHLMGDEALVITADTFRSLSHEFSSLFTVRYGGDEFLFTTSQKETSPDVFIQRFNASLLEIQNEYGFPLKFSISIGSSHVAQSSLDLNEVIAEADKNLYQVKEEMHLTALQQK